MKHIALSRVEAMIRRVVEEPFTWLSDSALDPFRLASFLANRYDNLKPGERAPNHFTVYLNQEDFQRLSDRMPEVERQVADYLLLMTERRGHRLSESPVITFKVDAAETAGRAHVDATYEPSPEHPDTAIFSASAEDATVEAIRAVDAFLIVQGRHHIPLDRAVTRIGRRMDNDIVLDSPSVSRQQAQIRWRQRYFVLYNVSSHGRTSVNGVPVQEHILRPGDVIGLSDVLMVYGEGRDEFKSALPPSETEDMDSTLIKPQE